MFIQPKPYDNRTQLGTGLPLLVQTDTASDSKNASSQSITFSPPSTLAMLRGSLLAHAKQMAALVVIALLFSLCCITPVLASTVTYTPSNLTLDSNAALLGGSNLRTASSNLDLNWNRPAVDANHIGYWRFDDGSGTTTADSSAQNNPGSFTSGSNPSWVSSSAFSPYAGNSAVFFSSGQKMSAGSVLNYEKTQPWTAMAAIKMSAKPASAAIIFSNVNANPYPGYELWVNSSGHLHVRLINNISGQYIGVEGTTDVTDNQWHFVAATYDGSSTAAGVKIYLDGVAQATTVESDNLTSASIVSTGPFLIGNQTNFESNYYMRGYIDEFSLSNVVRSASYISQHSTPSTLPSVDANMVLYYHFDEGTGTSATDLSSNSYTATLSNGGLWAISGVSAWQGDSSLYFNGADSGVSMNPISAYNLGSQFTLTSWADSIVTPGAGTLFYKVGGSPNPGYAFHAGYLNKMQWWDSSAFRNSTIPAALGWHQYGIRFNSGTLDFIVDGSIVKTLTGVSTPTAAASQSLVIGNWPGLGGGQWNGYMSGTTMSNTNRSDTYLATYAKRYPPSGVAQLSNVSGNLSSGGGNFGSTVSLTQLAATYSKPGTTNIQYRMGTGSSAAGATTDKQAQAFSTLSVTNSLSKSGQYVDFDLKLISSTDALAQDTPALMSVTVTYTVDITAPVISAVASSSTPAGATVAWTTDESASSIVEYGSTSSYGTSTTEADTSPRVTSHSVTLSDLTSCTTYHYRVRSRDASSNEGVGMDNAFITPGCTSSAGSSTSNSTISSTSTPSCSTRAPGAKTPSLYGAIAQNGTSVLLYFTEADDPVDHYVLQFGTSSGDYPYGATDIGGKASRTFLVQSLSPNTTYYFRVRGGNGCATGDWSNEISIKTKSLLSFNSLAITSFELEPLQQEQQISKSTSNCQPLYVVKAGDSLWSIAKHQLGDATKFSEIASQNSESYPAISSGILNVGWNIKINCAEQTDLYINGTVPSSQGYEVKIKVVDQDKKAVEGAKVTLYSTPREAITDKNGVVDYENVQAGQHKVLIAYNGFSGEQSVNLTGDVKEFDLSVQVSTGNPFLNLPVLLVIGILGTVVLILLFRLHLTRHKIL